MHTRLYSATPQGNQAVSTTMTSYPTQSYYPDIERTSLCPTLIMPSTWLGNDKFQFYKSLVSLDQGSNPRSPAREASALQIRPPRAFPKWETDAQLIQPSHIYPSNLRNGISDDEFNIPRLGNTYWSDENQFRIKIVKHNPVIYHGTTRISLIPLPGHRR